MIDKLKELFSQKEKEVEQKPDPKKEYKSNPTMEMIKKKILAEIAKIEPKEDKLGLHTMMIPAEPSEVEYSDSHHDKLQKFLQKPSMDDLKDLKKKGEWKHLNKIFAGVYEQE